jgi:eukaryotic-like serine/threonine-protein kinase
MTSAASKIAELAPAGDDASADLPERRLNRSPSDMASVDSGVENRYCSLFVIGRGGMGTVEVALDLDAGAGAGGVERVVALKRLLPEGARDVRHKEMFLREARLAALLTHPNVVHAFAFGEVDGELFMAMEYVEGEPLSHVLRAAASTESDLTPPIVALLLAQACDGLHAAHELRDDSGRGPLLHVVHRDVSPHNVMIAYQGHIKLLDFGVAKFDAGGNETRTGEVKGKMAYMSPEQALGEKLDRRSDLFSVGAVLFECLTGKRMWGSGTDMEVMRRLALEAPPRLDVAMPNAPRPLVSLHARLVAHDPERRPATARDVADELRAFARSSIPAPDGEAIRELMHRLFEQQAQMRRDQLIGALERVAPSRVDGLRRGLDAREGLREPTTTEPLVTSSSESRRLPTVVRSKTPIVVGTVLLAAVAMAAGLAATSRPTRETPPPREAKRAEETKLAEAVGEPPPSKGPTVLAATIPPAPDLPALGTETETATTPASAAASSPSAPHPRPRASPPMQVPLAPPPPVVKMPDVDPTPF